MNSRFWPNQSIQPTSWQSYEAKHLVSVKKQRDFGPT
jgi:hypothetical protein